MTAQGVIADSATKKAEEAGPDGIVRFMVALTVPWFSDDEIDFLRQIGMTYYMRTCRWASVGIPARCLLTLAEMAPVIRVG